MTEDETTRLQPVEIQHVRLRRRLFGYRRGDVDDLLENVTASYEEVWYERDALRDRVEKLLDELERGRERDRLVGDVFRNAHRLAEETVEEARRSADRVLAKARKRADELLTAAEREPERVRAELRALAAAENELHSRFRALVGRDADTLPDADAPTSHEVEQQPVQPTA